jgi:hypothetical protein
MQILDDDPTTWMRSRPFRACSSPVKTGPLPGCSKRLVELTSDQNVKLDLYFRLGRIADGVPARHGRGRTALCDALAINPSFVPALRKLSKIYEERHDWLKAAKMLETAQSHTANMVEKASYCMRAVSFG